MGCFSDWMPDLNYGDVSKAETNPCFQDLAASADKWINLGVDGLRLDAVKHICGGIDSYNNASNQTLLKKWYDHCNATYKAAGHTDDIFIVAEAWDGHNNEKNYYKGINSCFEFDYFGTLTQALNGNASGYVSTVNGFLSDHTAVRADAVTSIFMSNHDQHRAAESLGRKLEKEKQAAAMMLTTPGKPFVYQGEELGYYGKKDGGDEYVRTPMNWNGGAWADGQLSGKIVSELKGKAYSVDAQDSDANSILKVYKDFSGVRNTYPALAEGSMTACSFAESAIAAWYMSDSAGNRMLVVHNVSNATKTIKVSDDMSKPVAVLGSGTVSDGNLTLFANSSVVFKLY
jgi:glycosidase